MADLSKSRALLLLSIAASRHHSDLARAALREYGEHGAQISGCVRDHFPDIIKDRLRQLARDCGELSDAAYAAKPRGVHRATITKEARAIATRDGAGFYGHRPNREDR